MNSDRDHLLDDILAEPGGSSELRDALLNRTLRQVKRRRRVRRARWAGSVLLVLPALVLLMWHVHLPEAPKAASHPAPYLLVRTEPMPRSTLLETHPLATSGLVVSAPSPNLATITTHPESPGYREIDDATLLALAGTNAAVLVRVGPHSAQLVFASTTMAGRVPQ
jgi:hypothetical protein